MSIVAVDIGALGVDVAHGQQVELRLAGPTRGIDGKKNGPGDQTTQEAGNDQDLEEAHKQIAVNGLVIENVFILEACKVFDPAKEAWTGRWRLALLAQMVEVRPGRVHSAEIFAGDEKRRHKGKGEQRRGDECRDEAGYGAVGFLLGLANFTALW